MPKRTWMLGLGAVLVIAVLAAYQVGRGPSGPKISASPAGNLVDGQSVSIGLSGFIAGSSVRISECATAASANALGCGAELGAQATSVTGTDGSASLTFTVSARAAAGPLETGAIEACSNQCVIVATVGPGFAFASAPIAFEAP